MSSPTNNAAGFSGTNAGGDLAIVNSEWCGNLAGIVPNTLDSELTRRSDDAVIAGNDVHDNGNPDAADACTDLYVRSARVSSVTGGRDNLITRNRVEDPGSTASWSRRSSTSTCGSPRATWCATTSCNEVGLPIWARRALRGRRLLREQRRRYEPTARRSSSSSRARACSRSRPGADRWPRPSRSSRVTWRCSTGRCPAGTGARNPHRRRNHRWRATPSTRRPSSRSAARTCRSRSASATRHRSDPRPDRPYPRRSPSWVYRSQRRGGPC